MPAQAATPSGELDSLDMDAEHVMPPEHPTQDSALEDSVGQLSRVQNKLVDTLHALQLLPPHLVKDHNRAVRAIQEAVSYTHLDVYKRQQLCRSQQKGSLMVQSAGRWLWKSPQLVRRLGFASWRCSETC